MKTRTLAPQTRQASLDMTRPLREGPAQIAETMKRHSMREHLATNWSKYGTRQMKANAQKNGHGRPDISDEELAALSSHQRGGMTEQTVE